MPAKRKPGPRPSGKTDTILARVSPETRKMLEEARQRNSRSLSREIEARLSMSLIPDDFGSPETCGLMLLIADAITRTEHIIGKSWHSDPFAFDEALKAAQAYMERRRVRGHITPPLSFPVLPNVPDNLRSAVGTKMRKKGVGATCAAMTASLNDFMPFSAVAKGLELLRSPVSHPPGIKDAQFTDGGLTKFGGKGD